MPIAQGTNISTKGKTLEQLAKELGGKVRGNKVEYQVTGTRDGRRFKSTRYIRLDSAPEQVNTAAPVLKGDEAGGLNALPVAARTASFMAPAVPQLAAPKSVDQVGGGLGDIRIPTNKPSFPDMSGVGGMTDFYDKFFQLRSKEADAAATDLQAAEANQAKTQTAIEKFLSQQKSPSQIRDKAFKETGVNPRQYFAEQQAQIAEIGRLNEEYNKVVQAKDEQIAQTFGKLASNNFINNQQAQIERNAAPKLNAMSANIKSKAAIYEMNQGRFQEAQQFVNQAVEDASADFKFKFDILKSYYDMNENIINRLDSKYQRAFGDALNIAESAYKQQRSEKEQIGDLMLKYPNAGISIMDSFDLAVSKAQRVAPLPAPRASGDGSGSGLARFTTTQLNKGASNAGLGLEDFNALDYDVKNYYISSTAAQLKAINEAFQSVKSGQSDASDVEAEIDDANVTETVKAHLKERLVTFTPAPMPTQSFWEKFKNFFRN